MANTACRIIAWLCGIVVAGVVGYGVWVITALLGYVAAGLGWKWAGLPLLTLAVLIPLLSGVGTYKLVMRLTGAS